MVPPVLDVTGELGLQGEHPGWERRHRTDSERTRGYLNLPGNIRTLQSILLCSWSNWLCGVTKGCNFIVV